MATVTLSNACTITDASPAEVEQVGRFDFGVLEAATGSGKTTMALALVTARQQPTLVIVPTVELMHQWADRAQQFFDGKICGKVGSGKFNIEWLTIGVVNSVHNHLHELAPKFGFLIIDEAHRTPAKMFAGTVSAFDSKYLLGLSATPYRRDGLDEVVNFHLGRLVHRVDKQRLNKSSTSYYGYKQSNDSL